MEAIVTGKMAFERLTNAMGIKIKACHAENGTFKENGWVDACHSSNKRMTFAGVNDHRQNGMVDRRIRQLQVQARDMLTHASAR